MRSRLTACAVFGAFCGGALPTFAQSPPSLGSAASFAVLGASRVTNTGPTIIAGNVGVSPGSTVTGLSRSNFVLGDRRVNDSLARQAQKDNTAAYADLAARPCGTTLVGDLGGRTLAPGVYCLPPSTVLTGALTLDASGSRDAVWIFQVESSLTTAPESTVQTVNSGRDNKVFWRIGGKATFGATSAFTGTVLARADITLDRDANVSGRLLTQTGAVTLDDSAVTICCDLLDMTPHLLPRGTVGTPYAETLTAVDGKPPYTFAMAAGELPPGITFSASGFRGTPTANGVFQAAIVVTDANGFNCIRVYTISICGLITLLPLPRPLVTCIRYDESIAASGGTEPYEYRVIGLPDGLFGPTPTGILSGTPSATGDYDFTVTATDRLGCTGSRRYTGTITGALKLEPDCNEIPDGTVGEDYDVTFTPANGTGPFTCIFSGLAPGLTASGCSIAGKPTAGGCYPVTVTVRSSACEITKTCTIVIRPVITFSPDPLPPGKVCTPYRTTITASGCTGPYTFDQTPTGSLPPGLHFDAGVVSGTPTKPGSYSFTVVARGDGGHPESHTYTINVTCPEIPIDTELPNATACEYYEHQFTPPGCPEAHEFRFTHGELPGGLTLEETGLLSGTPDLPGDYTFDVIVTLEECPPTTFRVHLEVVCLVKLSPSRLSDGVLGVGYDETIAACGGTPPYTFSLASGNLPTGLTLSPDGDVTGIPTALGCSTFTVRATDSPGCFGERTYRVCIVAPGVSFPTLSGWALIALALLLTGSGLLAVRK
jgi:hypothetical protein